MLVINESRIDSIFTFVWLMFSKFYIKLSDVITQRLLKKRT